MRLFRISCPTLRATKGPSHFAKEGWGDLQPQSSHQFLGRDRGPRQPMGVLAGQEFGRFDHVGGGGPSGEIPVAAFGGRKIGSLGPKDVQTGTDFPNQ